MPTDRVSPSAIPEMALRVFSPDELQQLPRQSRLSLGNMIARRLESGEEPTLEELQGFRQLVSEDLWHPALGRLPEASQD